MNRPFVLLAAALVAGCAVGPDYRAAGDAGHRLRRRRGSAGVVQQPFEAAWWEQFGDPVLDGLVERALASDLDLKIAAARVSEARALLGRAAPRPMAGRGRRSRARRAQRPATWIHHGARRRRELPGRRRNVLGARPVRPRAPRSRKPRVADAEAAEADLRDAQVLVAAEVANTYLDLRGAQKRLRVAQANLANQRETLELTRVRLDLGRGSELDVASAAARYAATEASIPPLVAARIDCGAPLGRAARRAPGRARRSARASRARTASDDARRGFARGSSCGGVRTSAPRSASSRRPRRASALRRPICSRGCRCRDSSVSSRVTRTSSASRRAARGASRPCSRGPVSMSAYARASSPPKRGRKACSRPTSSPCCALSRRRRTPS